MVMQHLLSKLPSQGQRCFGYEFNRLSARVE